MAQGQIESYMKPIFPSKFSIASIAQLGERKTEDLKVAGSIPARSILLPFFLLIRTKYGLCLVVIIL
jgi:hypothetical protein